MGGAREKRKLPLIPEGGVNLEGFGAQAHERLKHLFGKRSRGKGGLLRVLGKKQEGVRAGGSGTREKERNFFQRETKVGVPRGRGFSKGGEIVYSPSSEKTQCSHAREVRKFRCHRGKGKGRTHPHRKGKNRTALGARA